MKVFHIVTDCTATRHEQCKIDNHAARCIATKLGVRSPTIVELCVAGINLWPG